MKCSQCGSTKFLKKDFLCAAKTLDERETDRGTDVFYHVEKSTRQHNYLDIKCPLRAMQMSI